LGDRLVRPHDLHLHPGEPEIGDVVGAVQRITRIGFEMRLEILVDGTPVTVTTTRNAFLALGIEVGSTVIVRADPEGAVRVGTGDDPAVRADVLEKESV
jgi:sulfate transport system ATP-binding protein